MSVADNKRAQIAVGDLWAAYGRQTAPGASPFSFPDIASLTCFADYRIPQLLRAERVLEYAAPLAARVDARESVAAGSAEELDLRACTVVAVERLRAALAAELPAAAAAVLTSVELDWRLWQKGERRKDEMAPHHRTLTIFY